MALQSNASSMHFPHSALLLDRSFR
jgi:hypothetical protein